MLFGSVVSRLCPSSTCPPMREGETQRGLGSLPLLLPASSVQVPMPAPVILHDKLLFLCRPAFGDMRMGPSSGQIDSLPWAGPSLPPEVGIGRNACLPRDTVEEQCPKG